MAREGTRLEKPAWSGVTADQADRLLSSPWSALALGRTLLAGTVVVLGSWVQPGARAEPTASSASADDQLLGQAQIPPAWRDQFWKTASAQALLRLDLKQISEVVPAQSGLRFCRCPACGDDDRNEPLTWSLVQPKTLKCRRCGVIVPNDKYPAKAGGKEVPEEAVEVLPGVIHHYPYHLVEDGKNRYPEERLYLQARIDYEARKYLARAALYAAAEAHPRPPAVRNPQMAALACVLITRFAQVYPAYATHYDQPGGPKYIQPARLQPPFRRGYQTGKWEWTGCLEVPMNLLMGYALIRKDPAWDEAGRLLGEPAPRMLVERQLFRAAAEFARLQPEEYSEDALSVYRGLVAVGRLLGDQTLVSEARTRLDGFLRHSFYHDGFYRRAEIQSHQTVVDLLDGWVGVMLDSESGGPQSLATNSSVARAQRPGRTGAAETGLPLIGLARSASAALGSRTVGDAVVRAAWTGSRSPAAGRRPILLGGAGVARLAAGQSANSLDVVVRGLDSYSGSNFQRLALRLFVAGVPVLDDLDERAATATGWDLATASHNAVVVNGLNQRETSLLARTPAAGSNFQFFAADPDFQVVCVDDPRAYPRSASRYRETVVVTASRRCRYAIAVFEVHGGFQHDQFFHAAPGRNDRWVMDISSKPPPLTLLPPALTFVPSAQPDSGRWFVQSYGELRPEAQASLTGPGRIALESNNLTHDEVTPPGPRSIEGAASKPPGVRLHLLGDAPTTLFTALSPDPTKDRPQDRLAGIAPYRASLIVRRQGASGRSLRTTFVTLFEPTGKSFPSLLRVGRVDASPEVVVLRVETIDGLEYVLVNLRPGQSQRVQLPGARYVSFDGLVLRVRETDLALAGGGFAEGSGRLVTQAKITGTITASVRQASERGLGWFLTPDRLPEDPAVAGRTLIVQHGDGSTRSWTLDSIEPTPQGTKLHVREEPGFLINVKDRTAQYYQFPEVRAPAPHRFYLAQIARSVVNSSSNPAARAEDDRLKSGSDRSAKAPVSDP